MHQMRLFKVNVSLLTGNFERIRWYTANAANRAARRGWHGVLQTPIYRIL